MITRKVVYKPDDDIEAELDMKLARFTTLLKDALVCEIGVSTSAEMRPRRNVLLARTCITYCTETIKEVWSCGAQVKCECIDVPVCVKDEAGEVVYESGSHLRPALTWLWKELLIIAATQEADSLSSTLLDDLRFNETERVFDLIKKLDKAKVDNNRFDKHWTPEMHATAEKVILQRPALVEHVRQELASDSPMVDAVEIFKRDNLFEDIVRLIPSICDSGTLCAVVGALANGRTRNEEYGVVGLKMIRDGLAKAGRNVMGEIEEAFPGLDDAEGWLEDEVYTKFDPEVLQKPPRQRSGAMEKDIERIIDEFVDQADGSSYEYRQSRYGLDEETPSLSQPILYWSRALVEWPARAEAEEGWNAVRWKTTDDPFGVNVILMKMSDHCESRRPYLCQGIRTMIKIRQHSESEDAMHTEEPVLATNPEISDAQLYSTLTKLTALLENGLVLARSVDRIPPPGIATSRRVRALATSILNAIPEDLAIQTLDFDGHRKRLSSILKKLESSCKNDWHDGGDEQAEYMGQISADIGQWLPTIWDILQMGGYFHLARTTEYGDCDTTVYIEDDAGEVIFKSSSHISDALTWFWKELLIINVAPKADPLSSTIIADLEKYNEIEDVFALIEGIDEEDRFRNHWTPEMHAASKELVLRRRNARIEEFMKAPTLRLYNSLVTESLKPSLIEGVRKDLSQIRPKIPLEDAVEIFKRNDLVDDIVPIVTWTRDSKTLCSMAKILSNSRSKKEEYGTVALKLLKQGLTDAREEIMNEIQDAFPGLEDATDWLEDVVYAKYDPEVLQKDEIQLSEVVARDVKRIVDRFVKKAQGSPYEYDRRYGSEDLTPNLSQPILDWLEVLGEWPNQAEAEEVWEEVRWRSQDDPFGVNGILLKMSYCCEEQRPRLSEGIRTMIKVYTRKDIEALSRPAANGKGATRPAKRRRVANTDAEDEKSDATLAMLNALLEGVLILAKEVGHVSAAGMAASRRARNLMTSISDTLPVDPAIQTLDFDSHRKFIGSVLEKLKKVCGADCDEDSDLQDQWDYMREISEDIAQWLPNIWDVLAGGDLFLARSCIVCCAEAVKSIRNAGTAADYGDHYTDVWVVDDDGEGMSWSHVSDALTWFWRELLIKAATRKADSLSSIIYADLQTFDETDDVFGLMKVPDNDIRRRKRFNEHWTPEMHETSEKLILQRQNALVEEFMGKPTLKLYRKIATKPLEPALVERIREALVPPRSLAPLEDAVEILMKNDLFDDILLLVPRVDRRDSKLLCRIAEALSIARSRKEEYGIEAVKLIKEGLTSARTVVMNEITEVFPGLDVASGWLQDEVYPKYDPEVLQKDPEQLDKDIAQEVERILDNFVKQADGSSFGFRWETFHSADDEASILSQPILDCSQALLEWPHRVEAEEVWSAVRWKANTDPFGVNGILRRMSDRCAEHRQHLSEGIRTMMKVYACKDMQELAKQVPKRPKHWYPYV
ncbi:hypothetical protein EYR36_010549 [Pleurotus pulmonarius]|nr:hypothetical protein EYR36_010549 [Pleurotus pulmonarius]